MTDKFYELNEGITDFFSNTVTDLAFAMKINYLLIGDSKQKKLIKISKTSDLFEYKTNYQIVVSINEDIYNLIEDDIETLKILFTEELESISMDMESGKIKIKKPDYINTTKTIVDKFGLEEIRKAKDLERLSLEQLNERKEDEKPTEDKKFN